MNLHQGLLFLAWLLLSTAFLTDGISFGIAMGDKVEARVRQNWLAVPFLLTPALLLLTPWRWWALAAVLGALLAHTLFHTFWFMATRSAWQPAPGVVTDRVYAYCRQWGVTPPASVMVDASGATGPAVAGLWQQTLLLPAEELTEEELAALLAHELAHVHRRDPLRLWLAGVAVTLLGWNPVARWGLRTYRLEVELEADRLAAHWLGDARTYAVMLARLCLRHAASAPGWGVALSDRPSDLRIRLQLLVDPSPASQRLRLPAWLQRKGKHKTARPPMSDSFAHWLIVLTAAGYTALFVGALWLF